MAPSNPRISLLYDKWWPKIQSQSSQLMLMRGLMVKFNHQLNLVRGSKDIWTFCKEKLPEVKAQIDRAF